MALKFWKERPMIRIGRIAGLGNGAEAGKASSELLFNKGGNQNGGEETDPGEGFPYRGDSRAYREPGRL